MKRNLLLGGAALVALALGTFGAAALGGGETAPPLFDPDATNPDPLGRDPVHRTIFYAVLEGLYEDGVPTALVDVMLEVDPKSNLTRHLIATCPICDPARDALSVYRSRPSWPYKGRRGDTFGAGLSPEVTADFECGDRKRQFDAMQACIRRWIERRLALMRLTEAERDRWQEALVVRRKKGMEALKAMQQSGAYAGASACPVCDGANDACKPK